MEATDWTEDTLRAYIQAQYGLDGTLKKLAGEIDLNYRLDAADGGVYIFKIAHPGQEKALLDMQHALMQHLGGQVGGYELPRAVPGLDGQEIGQLSAPDGSQRYTRLLHWLEGRLWAEANPHTPLMLESLGEACGATCSRLVDFDHPAVHRHFKWNLSECLWIKDQQHHLSSDEDRALVAYFIGLYEQEVQPRLPLLRQGVCHNDANDYNILVTEGVENRRVKGLIDLGDAVYSHTVNDLAIAAAYACMDKPDLLAAMSALVRGFQRTHPLTPEEIAVLFPLVAMRLCVSVTNSARNRVAEPDNVYLLVSERPAWDMLRQMRQLSPALVHYTLRHAAGWVPCVQRAAFDQWVASHPQVGPLLPDLGAAVALDLSVGSLSLGHNTHFETQAAFERKINSLLGASGAQLGIGGYAETRPIYTTDAYQVEGNDGPRWRTVHLGLDLWAAAGTPVWAPWAGQVVGLHDNAADRDYGPTLILRHDAAEGLHFYSLYGHLSRTDLHALELGQWVEAGHCVAHIGPAPENGNWPPHLHFQLMLDLLGNTNDFPGVAFPDEAEVWLSICPDPSLLLGSYYPPITSPTATKQEELLHERKQRLGHNLSLSYSRPLHILRGYGTYLYDHTGRRYLDTLNNVAHVGHQHPKVVQAACAQIEVLNTNTRYLHENIVRLATELTATLPDELNVCYFVNSGSEANELALRMAYTYTRQQDILALEVGYHGNTNACIGVSSYKFDGKGGAGAPAHTHILPMPDVYRGLHRGPDAGVRYASYAIETLAQWQAQGRRPAGFIAESILSCGGQIPLPAGYLPAVYEAVRAAGGLCIADEVQVGFGRVGEAFWGFELQGVVPDIVTMGKPIGNGHPIGAVVTTRAVAEAFANGMEYFNTFGGNPVSCAIGSAVLSVIAEEQLQAQAHALGQYLSAGLRDLSTRFPIIGDVRGPGLFLGFELVKDPVSLAPAAHEAAYLANRMRELGILISTDGPLHNVIKIKPPMCFSYTQADFLLGSLARVLQEDGMAI